MESIFHRISVRKFTDQPVEPEKMMMWRLEMPEDTSVMEKQLWLKTLM